MYVPSLLSFPLSHRRTLGLSRVRYLLIGTQRSHSRTHKRSGIPSGGVDPIRDPARRIRRGPAGRCSRSCGCARLVSKRRKPMQDKTLPHRCRPCFKICNRSKRKARRIRYVGTLEMSVFGSSPFSPSAHRCNAVGTSLNAPWRKGTKSGSKSPIPSKIRTWVDPCCAAVAHPVGAPKLTPRFGNMKHRHHSPVRMGRIWQCVIQYPGLFTSIFRRTRSRIRIFNVSSMRRWRLGSSFTDKTSK